MGCDIHIHVEYKHRQFIGKNAKGENEFCEAWQCGDYFYLNPYYGFENEKKYNKSEFCEGRNYSRFATLANVRNYGDTPYISEPRGLPSDVTSEVKADSDAWGCDGHSHSYLTLKELIDFQSKIPPLKHKGMISPQAQVELDTKGIIPEMYCQGTNQEGWAWREWETPNTVLVPLIDAIKKKSRRVVFDF